MKKHLFKQVNDKCGKWREQKNNEHEQSNETKMKIETLCKTTATMLMTTDLEIDSYTQHTLNVHGN